MARTDLPTRTTADTAAAHVSDHNQVHTELNRGDLLYLVVAGVVSQGNGTLRYGFPFAATIEGVQLHCGTAPTGGGSLEVDLKKNGTSSMFSGSKPAIALTTNYDAETAADQNNELNGTTDYVRVDITDVGDTVAGADLTVVIRYTRGA
jgi:hypothetical protein